LKRAPQPKIAKKTIKLHISASFKVIAADMTKKLITNACCDRQHVRAYLQLFSQ